MESADAIYICVVDACDVRRFWYDCCLANEFIVCWMVGELSLGHGVWRCSDDVLLVVCVSVSDLCVRFITWRVVSWLLRWRGFLWRLIGVLPLV